MVGIVINYIHTYNHLTMKKNDEKYVSAAAKRKILFRQCDSQGLESCSVAWPFVRQM